MKPESPPKVEPPSLNCTWVSEPPGGEAQPVQELTVREPMFPVVEKMLVELAIDEKKLVVVALVPVAVRKVKFWRVVEALAKS